MLVGYFRTSGFKKLYEALEHVDKVRILVGLSVDRKAFELIETSRQGLDFDSHRRTRASFESALSAEMEGSEDTLEVELSARKFVEFLRAGRLEMRAHPSKDIHAKVYISRYFERDRDFGNVITGSSNFSLNGLEAQREFNVELKGASDVRFALQKFESLWAEGVDISEAYIDTLTTKTWLNDRVTPYELFLKFLYEYFKEDLSVADEVDYDLPDGLMDLGVSAAGGRVGAKGAGRVWRGVSGGRGGAGQDVRVRALAERTSRAQAHPLPAGAGGLLARDAARVLRAGLRGRVVGQARAPPSQRRRQVQRGVGRRSTVTFAEQMLK